MKIKSPFYAVRIMQNEPDGDYLPLNVMLKDELDDACEQFTRGTLNEVLEGAKQLAIAQRIALNNYMTGLQIQEFANDIADQNNKKKKLMHFLKNMIT